MTAPIGSKAVPGQGNGPESHCFRESRIRLPARLLASAMPSLVFSVIAFGVQANDAMPFRPIGILAAAVSVVLVGCAVFRIVNPVRVACVGEESLWLRSRNFSAGWQELWQWRGIGFADIERIEIGRRSDYPAALSYSDTASYEFLLVTVRDADGRLLRYSYAPLQRVALRELLIRTLQEHKVLGSRVAFVQPAIGRGRGPAL
jgi:hypothetical protein